MIIELSWKNTICVELIVIIFFSSPIIKRIPNYFLNKLFDLHLQIFTFFVFFGILLE